MIERHKQPADCCGDGEPAIAVLHQANDGMELPDGPSEPLPEDASGVAVLDALSSVTAIAHAQRSYSFTSRQAESTKGPYKSLRNGDNRKNSRNDPKQAHLSYTHLT